jgi:hypothetical protein
VQALLVSGLLLGLLVGGGVGAIVAVRAWWRKEREGRGDWEGALAGYRALRDRGVLSDEEYRKITTLVEPYVRTMPMATSRVAPPVADRAESDHAARPSEDMT